MPIMWPLIGFNKDCPLSNERVSSPSCHLCPLPPAFSPCPSTPCLAEFRWPTYDFLHQISFSLPKALMSPTITCTQSRPLFRSRRLGSYKTLCSSTWPLSEIHQGDPKISDGVQISLERRVICLRCISFQNFELVVQCVVVLALMWSVVFCHIGMLNLCLSFIML